MNDIFSNATSGYPNNGDYHAIEDLQVDSYATENHLNIDVSIQNKVASTTIHTDWTGATRFTHAINTIISQSLFDGDINDLIVPLKSQSCNLNIFDPIEEQWHIGSSSNPAIIDICMDLLDKNPRVSPLFTNNGFPNDALSPPSARSQSQNEGLKNLDDSLKIINPLPGQVFNPGEDVPVNLFSAGDISRIGFIAYGNSIDPISIDTTAVPSLQFQIPSTAIGVINILALGGGSNNWYVFDTTHIIVNSSLIPDSITVNPKTINIPIGITKSLTVTGYFSGSPVNITGVPGLSVTNNSPSINYLNSGAIQGLSVGTTDLIFSYGGLTDIAHITVFDDPEILTSAFNFPGNKVCVNEVLEFSQTSIGIPTGFLWSFPGGTPSTSTLANPSILYENPGQYSVGLTTYFTNGIDAVTLDNIIYVNPAPDANIAASGPIIFCLGGNVGLTSSPGNSYLWSNGEAGQTITATTSGDYSVIVTDENGCSASSTPVSVTAFLDEVSPIYYFTDVLGNILADNDPLTPAGTTFNLGTTTVLPTDCDRQDQYYLYGFDNCDGFITALDAVSATAATSPATIIPGTQLTVTPDGYGFYMLDVNWSVGASTITATGRDAAGNTTALSLLMNVQDITPPTVSCAAQTITFNGQLGITLNTGYLVSATDNCGVQSMSLSPTNIACAQMGTIVPVTATVTDLHGNTADCISQITVTGLPCGWSQQPNGINCNNGSSVSYNPSSQIYTLTSTNCYSSDPFTSDAMAFAQRSLCGDGSITAQITTIANSGSGWAGVVVRESNAAGAKKVQLMTNLSSLHRREVRYTTGGASYPQQTASNQRHWLRIVRQGSQFIAYASPNGAQWYQVMSATVDMNACIEMGLAVTNNQPTGTVTATFANVSTTGNSSGLLPPGINEQLYDPPLTLDFSLFPNPTTGEININLSAYSGRPVSVVLYTPQGQQLRFVEIQEVQAAIERLDLSAFANGMYWIKVKTPGLPDVTKRVVLTGHSDK